MKGYNETERDLIKKLKKGPILISPGVYQKISISFIVNFKIKMSILRTGAGRVWIIYKGGE